MTKPIQIKNLTIGAGIPKICVPLTCLLYTSDAADD